MYPANPLPRRQPIFYYDVEEDVPLDLGAIADLLPPTQEGEGWGGITPSPLAGEGWGGGLWFQRLHPLLGGPYRPLIEQTVELLEAEKAFDKALDDKFGKDPNCRSFFALQSKPAKRVELRGKKDFGGGKVELTIWSVGEMVFETRETTIRENGGWVLVAPAPFTATTSTEETRTVDGREVKEVMAKAPELTANQLAAGRVALPQMRAVFERGAKDVAAGKHSSRQAAVTAVDKEVIAAFDQELGRNAGK